MTLYLKLTLHFRGKSEVQDGSFYPATFADLEAIIQAGARGWLSSLEGAALRSKSEILLKGVWYQAAGGPKTFLRTPAALGMAKEVAPRKGVFIYLHADVEMKGTKDQGRTSRVKQFLSHGVEYVESFNGDSAEMMRRKLILNLGKTFEIEVQPQHRMHRMLPKGQTLGEVQ